MVPGALPLSSLQGSVDLLVAAAHEEKRPYTYTHRHIPYLQMESNKDQAILSIEGIKKTEKDERNSLFLSMRLREDFALELIFSLRLVFVFAVGMKRNSNMDHHYETIDSVDPICRVKYKQVGLMIGSRIAYERKILLPLVQIRVGIKTN